MYSLIFFDLRAGYLHSRSIHDPKSSRIHLLVVRLSPELSTVGPHALQPYASLACDKATSPARMRHLSRLVRVEGSAGVDYRWITGNAVRRASCSATPASQASRRKGLASLPSGGHAAGGALRSTHFRAEEAPLAVPLAWISHFSAYEVLTDHGPQSVYDSNAVRRD